MVRDLSNYTIIPFDIETANAKGEGELDPRKGYISIVQLKYPGDEDATILDLLDADHKREFHNEIVKILKDPKNLIVGHNLKFDYRWLAYNGIFIRNPFDTMVASQILYAGLHKPDEATLIYERNRRAYKNREDIEPIFTDYTDYLDFTVNLGSRFSQSFAACMQRELGVEISKAEQASRWGERPLTSAQIEYAKSDVLQTAELATTLYSKIVDAHLEDVFWLEMDTFPAIAWKETIGVKVDREGWRAETDSLAANLKVREKALSKRLGLMLAEESGDRQGLFGLVPINVNINSPKMADWLGLPNMQAQTLKQNIGKHPIIKDLIEYKIDQKLVSTYGKTYIERIDKNDKRLRGEFSQAFTTTGRLSAKNPNLQNIPPKHIKSMLRPSKGYTLVSIDFSTVELRILAYLSGDEAFIASCNSKDMHAENARKIFGIAPGEPVPSDLRKKAKTVSFAVPYGTSAYGLFARGFTETVEEAKELIDTFYTMFPKVHAFLKNSAEKAVGLGYTLDALGRRRLYEIPEKPLQYEPKLMLYKSIRGTCYDKNLDLREILDMKYDAALVKYEEHDIDKMIPDKRTFYDLKEIASYEGQLSAIRREGQNHPIQATSASITKRALADVYEYLHATGYGYVTLSIHDSIFFELKNEYLQYSYPRIKQLMEDAGPKIVPNIVTPVDADFGWLELYELEEVQAGDKAREVHLFNQEFTGAVAQYLNPQQKIDKIIRDAEKEHGIPIEDLDIDFIAKQIDAAEKRINEIR